MIQAVLQFSHRYKSFLLLSIRQKLSKIVHFTRILFMLVCVCEFMIFPPYFGSEKCACVCVCPLWNR